MEFKTLWDLESAMKVLESDSVDSKLWAEAVEWLLIYGPPEIQQLLIDASLTATRNSFPELKPSHYTADGQPVYDVSALAKSLNVEEAEVREILSRKSSDYQTIDEFGSDDSSTVH